MDCRSSGTERACENQDGLLTTKTISDNQDDLLILKTAPAWRDQNPPFDNQGDLLTTKTIFRFSRCFSANQNVLLNLKAFET
jgi:hypothetical protein